MQSESERTGRRDPVRRTVGSVEGSVTELAEEVNTVFQAWSQANTALVTGSVRVLGDLLVGLSDAVNRGGREFRESAERESVRDDVSETDAGSRVQGSVGGVARTVARAVNQQAKVIQDSTESFSNLYERRTRSRTGARRQYADMTVDELQELARERDIPGRSEMNKQELINALDASDRSSSRG